MKEMFLTNDRLSVKEKIMWKIQRSRTNSAWTRGVRLYALELVDDLDDVSGKLTPDFIRSFEHKLLNGAETWMEYSYGGNALVYDCDIAERLCNPTQLKRVKGGEKPPNNYEEWLDVQTEALGQAAVLIRKILRNMLQEETEKD